MAVMITDILLLDFFNTLGMPTSTTVSIVLNCWCSYYGHHQNLSIWRKIESTEQLHKYSQSTQIIFGILLSVVVAFSVGAIIQWISRYLLTFYIEETSFSKALFGGISLANLPTLS